MNFKINHDKTAAVSLDIFWVPVGPDTPQGVSMFLINEPSNVSIKGKYNPKDPFPTHWLPNPKFPPKDKND